MDASGNLTSAAEFVGGRTVRLISYLDPDVAMGVFTSSETDGFPYLGVHRLSSGNPSASTFSTGAIKGFEPGAFYLQWTGEAGCYVSMEGQSDYALNCLPPTGGDDGDPPWIPAFLANFVDGCWFNLTDFDQNQVVDISESNTNEQNPIIAFKSNGGDNQKWRAQDINFKPPVGVALSNDDTPAAAAASDPAKSGKPG